MSRSSSAYRYDAARFVPALRRLPAALRWGRTTADLDMDADEDEEGPAPPCVGAFAGGDSERLRLVVGRPRPFFLKNGTVTFSGEAMFFCAERMLVRTVCSSRVECRLKERANR